MVFCYKTITDSPRHRKLRRMGSGALSELITLDYGTSDLDSIPEREWRLLAALARKKEEEDKREKLAEQFRKMWQQEKEGREMMEAKTALQYKRFLNRKRDDERMWLEHRRMLQTLDQQYRKGQLLEAIKYKDQKTEELLAWREGRKSRQLVNKALEEEARAMLAAERRNCQQTVAAWTKKLEAEDTRRRADEAIRRRDSILRDSSRRLAISSALNNWESSMVREQLAASEAARRAQYSALAAMAEERGERLARQREAKRRRARVLAAKCAQWREAVRQGYY